MFIFFMEAFKKGMNYVIEKLHFRYRIKTEFTFRSPYIVMAISHMTQN